MDNPGTVCHGYIVVTVNKERLLMLFCRGIRSALVQRLVFLIFQILSLKGLQDLICLFSLFCQRPQHLVQQRLCQIISIAVHAFYLCVRILRIYAERDIGEQRPGRSRPGQKPGILILHFKADNRCPVLNRLIALRDFVGRKRCTAGRTVGHNLKALIQQTFFPDLLQSPPLGFNIVIIIGNIRVIHVGPESDLAGELFPHPLIFPDRFLAFFDERLNPVFLDLILALDADFFFHFQLYRKSVRVPSGLSGHLVSLHGAVARNHILDNTGEHMTDVRLAVCRRRSVIEHIGRTPFPLLYAFFKDMVFFPEFLGFCFPIHKIQVGIYFLIHESVPLLSLIVRLFLPYHVCTAPLSGEASVSI